MGESMVVNVAELSKHIKNNEHLGIKNMYDLVYLLINKHNFSKVDLVDEEKIRITMREINIDSVLKNNEE
jgi:hypothetical protein